MQPTKRLMSALGIKMTKLKKEYDPTVLRRLLLEAQSSVDIIVQEPDIINLEYELKTLTGILDMPSPRVARQAIICKPTKFYGTDYDKDQLQGGGEAGSGHANYLELLKNNRENTHI